MTKIDNNAKIQTLKQMLSVAKKLAEYESNEIFELGHPIADNVLNKICMLAGLEKGRPDLIYKDPDSKRKITKDFRALYKYILEDFFPNVPKYNKFVKRYHRDRNTYNHDIISLDFSIRMPLAISYINFLEDIMREVGYLGKNETIEPYISNILIQELDVSQKQQLTRKFKDLYNKLASRDPEHAVIDVKTSLESIGKIDLGKVLKMECFQESKERTMLREHNKWNLSIRTGSSQHLRLIKYVNGNSQVYDFEIPNKNENILNEYLDLIRDRCKEQGLNV